MPKIPTEILIEKLSSKQHVTHRLPAPLAIFSKAGVVSLLYLTTILAIMGVRSDISHVMMDPFFMTESAFILITAGIAMAISILFAFPDRQLPKKILLLPISLFVLFNAYLAYQLIYPAAFYQALPQTHSFTYECTRDIILFSIFPLVMMAYILKMGAVTQSNWAALTASIAAACLSYLAVRFMEANDNIIHLIQWHYLPMLLIIILSLVIGRKILKW
jgi:hypothetical protein